MRRFFITMIAIFGVIAISLVILMATVIHSGETSKSSSFSVADVSLVKTSNLSMEGITELSLEYSSDDILFYESDTEELILKEYMSITPNDNELTQIKQTSSELRLRGGDRMRQNWIFNHYSGYVEVYLPADYHGSISASTSSGNIVSDLVMKQSDFAAACSSGDIRLHEVYATEISAATSSGNIEFDRAEGIRSFASSSGDIKIYGGNGDTDASCTSGNITINENTGELRADSSSGNITIEAAIGSKKIETTSGDISMSDCSGFTRTTASSGNIEISALGDAGDFETTSGNIKVSFTEELLSSKEDIIADASSGNVEFRLPSEVSFDFTAETSSGDIDTYFDDSLSYKQDGDYASGTVGASPNFRMEITTTSGNIDVEN